LAVNLGKKRQLEEYGPDGITYIQNCRQLQKYIGRRAVASPATAISYRSKLNRFGLFIFKAYPGKSYDDVLANLKDGKIDPYDLLADFAATLGKDHKVNHLRTKVKQARKFLKFCGVKIDLEEFQESVPLPRKEFPDFDGTEKAQIVELLNNTKNQRLKTAMIMFGATGCRAQEGCSVTLSNIDFEANTITFPAKSTKMRKERTRPMTQELASQLKIWIALKYRKHFITDKHRKRRQVEPVPHADDLILAFWHESSKPTPAGIYKAMHKEYVELAEMLKMKFKGGRRVITFHSFRRFVKSTISDLGHGDFSEWFIGHAGSTYYRKTEKERLELFRKIEPYLTFMDVAQLEARGMDQQTRLDQMQAELQKEREERAKLYELLYQQGIIKKE
jgi:integrase